MRYRHGIQHRLVLYVSMVLLVISVLSGGIAYRLAFEKELLNAVSLEQQLVKTVQAQAEVAVYAENVNIAEGVIEGLSANPGIRAIRITGNSPQKFSVGAEPKADPQAGSFGEYPLFSPVDGIEQIGNITLFRNDTAIRAEATTNALHQTLLLLLHILITAFLIVLFSRQLLGKPVAELAEALAAIKPGSGARVSVPAAHANNEIGSLAQSANALIEAAEQALAEVQALASTDALTGLLNRRAFMARLTDQHARLQRHELVRSSVLMLDLDHFKHINDAYGHAAGDGVLQNFGALLAREIRVIDSAGRIGGEEFAILLPDTEPQAALNFAERLRLLIAQTTISHAGTDLSITVSIGIASLSASDSDAGAGLLRADRALYQAKHAGRNRVTIDPC
jgi:diguanylate cyclase (GGDEF)-like protein